MPTKKRRNSDNICDWKSSSKNFNFDSLLNTDAVTTNHDDIIVIWVDASINKDNEDDQYTINQLYQTVKSIRIFTNEKECLTFINKSPVKNKLFIIVSGSVGKKFVPEIHHLSQINSIYVFCGKKINHEAWAAKYKKVKGVFDDITDLCARLEKDKQEYEQKYGQNGKFLEFLDALSKGSVSPYEYNELINYKNSKYDDHQPKDDIKRTVPSADIPFSKEERPASWKEVKISNNLYPSKTVTPFMQYKQQMEFSDTGIWPCVSVIDTERNAVFNHLRSVIEPVKYSHSVEECLQYVDNHRDDYHLIVLCNPINVEHDLTLIVHLVWRVYIYCSNNRINEYDALAKRYSDKVSVLQNIDTLTRLILWDLSACIVTIGNNYDSENKNNLAQARYLYAYRLHIIFQGDLNNRIEMIEYSRPTKFNN